ncbi:MAG: dihydropteroate synthase [Niabella sp.]|nr:MAG: dihydropteroate synthase [Niabella sp.]
MFTLNCKGKLLVIKDPIVMGILNINNDSFYSGSRLTSDLQLLSAAEKMIVSGASILDVGGQSSRPGSERISSDLELFRVLPAIELIIKNFPDIIISIDTYQARVAREAINAGASIINDISGGEMDEELINTVAELQVPYILMHMKGTPQTMQQNPKYENLIVEIMDYFTQKISILRSKGVKDIIVDPGFGFGKTIVHNFQLLKNLSYFKMLECPILLGVSRKASIYKTLQIDAEDALNGTTVLNTIGLLNGANILRVHDVREAKEAIQLFSVYQNNNATQIG